MIFDINRGNIVSTAVTFSDCIAFAMKGFFCTYRGYINFFVLFNVGLLFLFYKVHQRNVIVQFHVCANLFCIEHFVRIYGMIHFYMYAVTKFGNKPCKIELVCCCLFSKFDKGRLTMSNLQEYIDTHPKTSRCWIDPKS